MSSKQLSIPGLPATEPKEKRPMKAEHLSQLEGRILALELEVSLLRIQLDNDRGEDA